MKRGVNKIKKVCFDLIPIASIRRCSANIPYNFVPRLRPKKEQETPTPLILSIPEHMTYYSDDEKNCKNSTCLKPNRKISKIIKPTHNTKSSKQVGYKKIASCCVRDEKRMKWEEDVTIEAPINFDHLDEDNLFVNAKSYVALFPKSRSSIFKAIEKHQSNNSEKPTINKNIDILTSGTAHNIVEW